MELLFRYLWHLIRAKSKHSLHSPFVFEFATRILPHKTSRVGQSVGALRKELLRSTTPVSVLDLGAGSGNKGPGKKDTTIGKIAARSSRKPREGELLYRICSHYQPQRCLEFGTNLGLSTLYQFGALDPGSTSWISMEGAPDLARLAQQHAERLGLSPRILTGEFSQILDTQLDLSAYKPDYVFIDGNHRYTPTMEYFRRLIPHVPDGGLIVFDDINWSAGMRKAWREICRHPEVTVSIDLFFMGLCFLRRPQAKEHFRFPFRNL